MKRARQDNQRFIMGAILVTAAAFVALIVLLTQVSFDVQLHASVEDTQGEWVFVDALGTELTYTEPQMLDIPGGGAVQLSPGAEVQLEIVENSDAYAFLGDGAQWRLVEATRSATVFDHIRGVGDFHLVIEQSAGRVVYNLSQATFKDFELILRFADGETTVSFACFQATAPTEESASAVVEIPCEAD